jgi:hypothetical protein
MIFDRQALFSNAQAITATAGSTDVIDLQLTGIPYGNVERLRRDIGRGEGVPILIQVVQAFNNLTSLEFKIQTSDDPAFGSGVFDHYTSGAILLASLLAGWKISHSVLPDAASVPGGMRRYMRTQYVVVGTAPTAGQVTAGIVAGVNNNVSN